MDLDFSAEDNAFRQEARAFIADNYPKVLRDKQDRVESVNTVAQAFITLHDSFERKTPQVRNALRCVIVYP